MPFKRRCSTDLTLLPCSHTSHIQVYLRISGSCKRRCTLVIRHPCSLTGWCASTLKRAATLGGDTSESLVFIDFEPPVDRPASHPTTGSESTGSPRSSPPRSSRTRYKWGGQWLKGALKRRGGQGENAGAVTGAVAEGAERGGGGADGEDADSGEADPSLGVPTRLCFHR